MVSAPPQVRGARAEGRTPPTDSAAPGILWRGPLTDPSGYAAGGRAFLRGLSELGTRVRPEPRLWNPRRPSRRPTAPCSGPSSDLARIDARWSTPSRRTRSSTPTRPGACWRTMFETDRIPAEWVARCNALDEVWVPTAHNREAFAAAGVDPERLASIPEPFELDRLGRDAEPLHLQAPTAPCSWPRSTGAAQGVGRPDRRLVPAFTADDDVTLVLKVWSTSLGMDTAGSSAVLGERSPPWGSTRARRRPRDHRRPAPGAEHVRLYAAADAVVAPTRGEGWGRPLLEAMALGRPVIATAWSGPAAFVDAGTGWPIGFRLVPVPPEAVAEVPAYAGHGWAEPDVDDLAPPCATPPARPASAPHGGRGARAGGALDHRRVARWPWSGWPRRSPHEARLARTRPRPLPWAASSRAYLSGLRAAGSEVALEPLLWQSGSVLPERELALAEMAGEPVPRRPSIQQVPGRILDPYAAGRVRVAVTCLPGVVPGEDWLVRLRQ